MIRDNTGLSYSDYIQKVRIDKACTMLAESREPIDQIIEQVGYRNKSFFYSIFLKQTGKTPSQYRRENAGTLEKKD